MTGPFDTMPTRRRPPPTPALDALSGTEHSRILTQLLTSHPELRPDAEDAARRLLGDASVEAVAESVAWAFEELPLDALAMRSGRGRGYLHETEAALEILSEAVEPSLADLRRRASLGLDAEVAVAAGIVAGLTDVVSPRTGPSSPTQGPTLSPSLRMRSWTKPARLASCCRRMSPTSSGPTGPYPADVRRRRRAPADASTDTSTGSRCTRSGRRTE